MKKPGSGKRKHHPDRFPLIAAGLYFCFVLFLLVLTLPDLKSKHETLLKDKTVAFALDYEDLVLISQRENRVLQELLDETRTIPVTSLSVQANLSSEEEQLIRQKGFSILWRGNESGEPPLRATLARFAAGDGVLPLNEFVLGYPGMLKDVGARLVEVGGILPIVEFGPRKGLGGLMSAAKGRWVKTHVLHLEEVITPKFRLWDARLVRAVKERGLRLLLIRLSPAASFSDDVSFLQSLKSELESDGYLISSARPFEWMGGSPQFGKFRTGFIFIIALLGPLAVLVCIRQFKGLSPIVVFTVASLVSILIGLSLHGLGSVPSILFGIDQIRGVKLLLVVPLAVGLWLLLNDDERSRFLESNLKVKYLLWGGVLMGVLGGLYLMRSGNFPLFSVSDSERSLRDVLENFLGARPRFKEFLFAHPLMVVGLLLQNEWRMKPDFFRDGRLFILAGVIGQISILNTFVHAHIPVEVGLLRTVHGLWLGLLFSIPLAWVFHRKAAPGDAS